MGDTCSGNHTDRFAGLSGVLQERVDAVRSDQRAVGGLAVHTRTNTDRLEVRLYTGQIGGRRTCTVWNLLVHIVGLFGGRSELDDCHQKSSLSTERELKMTQTNLHQGVVRERFEEQGALLARLTVHLSLSDSGGGDRAVFG